VAHLQRSHPWLDRGPGLAERLEKMVRTGRLTEGEAARLVAAADSGGFEDAAREIQLRHARARVSAAVEEGSLTDEDARALLERLESGEDPRFLRGLRSRRRIGSGG